MEDHLIIAKFFERDESALTEVRKKYGAYCRAIARRILNSAEDAEECENDTYLDAWNAIPPARPRILSVFLGSITRRIALDRYRRRTAEKRGGTGTALSLSELSDCIPSGMTLDEHLETKELAELLSRFLKTLPETECNVFLRRYWYFDAVKDIAKRFDFSESKTKMMLARTREKLQKTLEKEDIFL